MNIARFLVAFSTVLGHTALGAPGSIDFGHANWADAKVIDKSGATVFLSDLPWASATNGWGPVERDMSNGDKAPRDGRTMSLNGQRFSRGLGTHAASQIVYALDGTYQRFLAHVGIDDEVGTANANVAFLVYVDGVVAHYSGPVNSRESPRALDIGLAGVKELKLVVVPFDPEFAVPTTYLSDLVPVSVRNSWGPYERDMSNGEQGSRDGRSLTLNGTTYKKGLGVHVPAEIVYNVGNFTKFSAEVGVDDEVGANGSVIFQVALDGVVVFDSGVLTGNSNTAKISLDLRGKKQIRLSSLVGKTQNFGHANWANAHFSSGATSQIPPPPPAPAPTPSPMPTPSPTPTPSSCPVNSWLVNPSMSAAAIQGLINSAPVNATICFKAGTYSLASSLLFASDRTYRGEGASASILRGPTNAFAAISKGTSNVKVLGLTFEGRGLKLETATRITVQDSVFRNLIGAGVDPHALYFVGLSHSTITHNRFENIWGDNAILGYNTEYLTLEYNRFDDVHEGVHIINFGPCFAKGVSISRNHLTRVQRMGIEMQESPAHSPTCGGYDGLLVEGNHYSNPIKLERETFAFSIVADKARNVVVRKNFAQGPATYPGLVYAFELASPSAVSDNFIVGSWVAFRAYHGATCFSNRVYGAKTVSEGCVMGNGNDIQANRPASVALPTPPVTGPRW